MPGGDPPQRRVGPIAFEANHSIVAAIVARKKEVVQCLKLTTRVA